MLLFTDASVPLIILLLFSRAPKLFRHYLLLYYSFIPSLEELTKLAVLDLCCVHRKQAAAPVPLLVRPLLPLINSLMTIYSFWDNFKWGSKPLRLSSLVFLSYNVSNGGQATSAWTLEFGKSSLDLALDEEP